MNATTRLDLLLSNMLKNPSADFRNGISQETSIQPSSTLTCPERESNRSTVLSSTITAPLPPRRDSSSMKHHRRRPRINSSDQQKPDQPLLNSSTLDDLFRALTLECEQCLAATSSYQNKTYGQILVQPSSTRQPAAESNDDDYENLHTLRPSQAIKSNISPLKTSIEVISPIKRHVVSITVSSKVSSSQLVASPSKPKASNPPTPVLIPATLCHSSEEDVKNASPSSTKCKRRRRTRKQMISSSTTRSSSSSNERKEIPTEKKPLSSKRSCSTDPRYQRHKNSHDHQLTSVPSTQKQSIRRPHRRDVSLQHSFSNAGRSREDYSSPLSVLLTSTNATSDFLDHSHQQQQRRSRLESVGDKSSTLFNRIHQQFHRPSSSRDNTNNKNKNNNNIPTHRIPSYPVY